MCTSVLVSEFASAHLVAKIGHYSHLITVAFYARIAEKDKFIQCYNCMLEQVVKDIPSIYCLAILRTPVHSWECKAGILKQFRSLYSQLG
jgi:hypothetical protein